MVTLHRLRKHIRPLARLHLALFALVWLSLAGPPCAMAMQLGTMDDPGHGCPHCPPQPCHEVQPQDCDEPDSLDAPRLADQIKTPSLGATVAPAFPRIAAVRAHAFPADERPRPRAGPRPHLLHLQFNE